MGNPQVGGWTTIVYEAAGDNLFQVVDKFTYYDGVQGGTAMNALGDLDGKAPLEYLMRVSNQILIYQPTQPGIWTQIGSAADPDDDRHFGLQVADVNRNGVDEVFWDGQGAVQSQGYTVVLEHPLPTDVGPRWEMGSSSLIVTPNPCREFTLVTLPPGSQQVARLSVFDAAGRMVERRTLQAGSPLRWSPLASGTFFLRLDDPSGKTTARGRVVAVR